ncbi:MAG TPA: chemotaxis protein CheW [Candidatus Marinimicrobia bacterium]|nr:chemotaxis protein CheW [Candidatus Neomarinimicrobiota bacterium]
MDKNSNSLLIFSVGEQKYALYLSVVERVVRIVEITPLPESPEEVAGVIDLEEQIIPVFDMRKKLNLPARDLNLLDQLIIANTSRRRVALWVENVNDVEVTAEDEIVSGHKILAGMEHIDGVVKLKNSDIALIYNLDRFLHFDDEKKLHKLLDKKKKEKTTKKK